MPDEQKPSFTPKQGQYLAFIDAYTRVNLRPPAEADIQHRFDVTPPSVRQMILTLERRPDPASTQSTAQYRGARAAPAPTRLGNAGPNSQNLCVKVLGAKHRWTLDA